MIEKLKLEHIQCYPMDEDKGIMVQTCTRTISSQGEPMGYKTGRLIGFSARTECEILFDKDDFAVDYELSQIKPILRPLSDLTKEIEVNGVKFIPLIELAKIAYYKDSDQYNKYKLHIRNTGMITVDMGISYQFLYNENEMSFECQRMFYGRDDYEYSCYVPNQYKIFNKLFEWHFDMSGLIKVGLAKNINILE